MCAMIRLCGASLGLFAFSVTIFLGLGAGNPVDVIVLRAVWAMIVFCGIGLGVGWIAHRVIDEHAVRRARELFPPEEEEPVTELSPAGASSKDETGA
jgi:hypothetical protein